MILCFIFSLPDDEKLESGSALTNLVQLCFGRPLDKSNQFSNWNNRPLREEQMMYAALDAYCLIEIYETIRARFLSMKVQHVDFNEFVHCFLIENKNKISVNKKNTQGASNGNISTTTKLQMRQPPPPAPPTSNNKNQYPPKSRPQYRHRDDEHPKSKH